jgi:hypothetical protein
VIELLLGVRIELLLGVRPNERLRCQTRRHNAEDGMKNHSNGVGRENAPPRAAPPASCGPQGPWWRKLLQTLTRGRGRWFRITSQ